MSTKVGLTMVEVLVALAVLAVAGASYASLAASALRSERVSQQRQLAASALEMELLYQRVGPAAVTGACAVVNLPVGWNCQVAVACASTAVPCSAWVIEVELEPPTGSRIVGLTARFDPPAGAP